MQNNNILFLLLQSKCMQDGRKPFFTVLKDYSTRRHLIMAAHRTIVPCIHPLSQRRHVNATRFRTFALAAFLLSVFALFGCGGGVSMNEQTGNVTPGTGTGTATLSWAVPTTKVDGTPLTDLAGYKVYFGTSPGVYTSIVVGDVTSYQIDGLTKGQTYYFTVTAYDMKGLESDYAPVASKLIS